MKEEHTKLISLILLTTLLINPIVLFIITDNFLLSFLGTVSSLFIMVLTYKKLYFLSPYVFSLLTALSIIIHSEAIFINNFKEYMIEDLYAFSDKYYFNRSLLHKNIKEKEYSVSYVTSEQGFRIGTEDNPYTKITECDWLFLGDSYTQGAQVEFEELYTSRLYKNFPEKIIINSGISGWGIPEEYNYYVNEGYKLKPKKVFLEICNFNDFMNVNEKESTFTDFIMHKSEFLRFMLYPFKYANPAELPLGRWTEPFYPTKEYNQDYNVFFKTKSERQNRDLKNFSEFLYKLNDAVSANGSELIVFQIPSKEQLYYKYFEEVVKGFDIKVEDLDMNYPNEFLSGICKKKSIKYLDLLPRLGESNEEVFFQYDEHLNTNGHNKLATILRDYIKENIELTNNYFQVLSQHNSEDRYPIFQDVNLIAYQSVRDSNIELFIADSLLENSKRITFNNVDELHPWLDNKGRLIFTEGSQEAGTTKVGSMQLNGANREYITKKGYYGSIPSFNKLHTKIAYPEWTTDVNGDLTNPVIVIWDLIENNKTKITNESYESWRPIFSPNDSSLFYISKHGQDNFDIYKYDIVHEKEVNLTKSSFDEWDPFIDPDGRKIVYAGFKDANWDIFILDLITGEIKQITHTTGNEWDTSFSPDGKYIYYAGVYGFMNGIYRLRNGK